MRDTDADESRAPKRHRPLEPPPSSGSRRREPIPPLRSRLRSGRSPPPPFKDRRRARSPPSKDRRRARSPPYVSTTQHLAELQRTKRPLADAAVDDIEEGEIPGLSPLDGGAVGGMEEGEMVERRPSHSHCNCKMDGKNQRDGDWKKGNSFIKPRMKSRIRNCYNCKEPGHFADNCPYENKDDKPKYMKKGNSIIKPSKKSSLRYCYNCKEPGHFADDCPYEERDAKPNYVKKDAKPNLMPNPLNMKKNIKGCEGKAFIGATYTSGDEEGEKENNVVRVANLAMANPGSIFKYDHKAPSRSVCHKKTKRQRWAEAKMEMREMKKDKLLENIKKLQACVWLLEKDGADIAEIMKFRRLLESTKKQYVENDAQLAQQVSSASQRMLNRDRLEKMHVEKMPDPVEKVEGDEQNMDCGKVEGRSLKGCKAVSQQNDLAGEVNRLKSELETVRQDRDYQLTQAQSLMADIAKHKEVARRYGVELEDAMRRVATLEKGCLLQRETIRTPQIQLASANEELTVPSPARY